MVVIDSNSELRYHCKLIWAHVLVRCIYFVLGDYRRALADHTTNSILCVEYISRHFWLHFEFDTLRKLSSGLKANSDF